MRRIEEWLGDLGLGEYAARFVENKIDFSILSDLTDQDVKDLGITAIGDRRKLLRAISELTASPEKPRLRRRQPPRRKGRIAAAELVPLPSEDITGERRYLTVLFCDLVDSTGIASRLDAEEWRDLVGAYFEAASAAVTEMGGTVAKKLGDGLMALFGYPTAHENDAERAARAALAIQRAITELNRKNMAIGKPELSVRIGLETGPVVVDAAGEIFGDAPNVASRLQALAEPGAIMITGQVQRQIAGLFVAEERGSHELKGLNEPVTLFRLVRASGGRRRSSQRMPTPLVDRDEEIAMLMRRWERARQGDGQLVLIVGEPGLGKSRLIEEFHARLRDTPHTWVEWSCSQMLQNTPLHPVAEWGRQRFGGADVSAERRFADLESTLAQVKLDPDELVPLLAPLLDMPLPPERAAKLAPEELRRRQLAALTNWLLAGAKVQPVVLAFEDLHWADPTTLDVLKGIAERGALAPLFVLATARPEFKPPWGSRSHHGTISLVPLDRSQVRHMVGEITARHTLPQDVIDGVTERTGGVPLFIEEVTRLLLERGEQGDTHVIPPTLQQSLTARLDRLGPARDLAQVGSVIGRSFSYGLLSALAGMEEAALQAVLEQLAEADILLVQGLPPDSDYRFKHALIQDAAYENLLKSRRQVLHRRIAEILRDRFPDTATAEPEVLAHHFTQAGLTDAAIEWWSRAGDQALRRSAFKEAISHLGRAIEMADKTGDGASGAATGSASANQRLILQTNLGRALMFSRGYAAEESKAAFSHARELAASSDDPPERFTIYYGLWVANFARGELRLAREIAETFLREAEGEVRATECGAGRDLVGLTCLFQGDLNEAQTNFVEALSTHDPERDREGRFRFGLDIGATARVYLATTKWLLGEVGPARALVEEAVGRAIETGHIPSLVHAHMYKAHFEMIRGDARAAARDAEIVVRLSQENALTLYATRGSLQSAWASARPDIGATGAMELRQALAAYTGQGKLFVPFYQGLLAELEAEGDAAGALTRIDEALALAGETGEHWSDAFLHHLRGEILLKHDPAETASAEEAFLTAIAIAQQQKAHSFELRAALGVARLYQSTSRAADAHALLAPALEGFLPTPEFPEIEEAQALLGALAETDEVKNAAASRQRRLKLQTSLGQALAWSRGFAAEEAKAAFIHARELAATSDDPIECFNVYYGLWVSNQVRGELRTAREIAETFLREAEREAGAIECEVGRGLVGRTCLWQGDFTEARSNFMRVLSTYDPARYREGSSRFGDVGSTSRVLLAITKWLLGEVGPAQTLIEEAVAHAIQIGQLLSLINTYLLRARFEMVRGNAEAARRDSEIVVKLSQEKALTDYAAMGAMQCAWASARLGDPETGATELRRALAEHIGQGNKFQVPFFQGLLAEIEAEGDARGALIRIDEALTFAHKTGEHWSDAFLHHLRGKILLKCDPANTAPAEEAFLTAIAVAQQQKARSFELRAALDLARLYQSAGRSADAHALLASALEGFSPTPEFPEIEEVQALLAALAETDEVKNAAASRQRRLKLQTSLGQALLYSRGYAAEESKAAFIRAQEIAEAIHNPAERFTIYHGMWLGNLIRGELGFAREIAETFLREAERRTLTTECALGRRLVGFTCFWQGDFVEEQANLVEALNTCDPERDREVRFRFGMDFGALARAYLAITKWLLGEVGPARALIEEAIAHAIETGHIPTLGNTYNFKALFEMVRGDAAAVRRYAEILVKLGQENALTLYAAMGALQSAWANARLDGSATRATGLRQALAAFMGQRSKILVPFFQGLVAEIEAEGDAAGALIRTDEALALAGETGEHWSDAFLHRLRGKILLKCDPANTAQAEEAFLRAIAIAQQQKARSFELRAALDLARLYHSTNRSADAHTLLSSALEGFSPTPEFPEIAEAQALLAALAETDEVKNAAASRQRRLKLQTSLGRALMLSRGLGAEEAKAAFIRARELAAAIDNPTERFNTYYGLYAGNLLRGELELAREAAETFLREAKRGALTTECAAGHHLVGATCFFQGDFVESQANFVEALRIYNPERDREARFRIGIDIGATGRAYLAIAKWLLGEGGPARALIEEAVARAVETAHVPTQAVTYSFKALYDMVRGDAGAVRGTAAIVVEISQENALTLYAAWGALESGWASARLDSREIGVTQFRQALAAYVGQGNKLYVPFAQCLLAEIEAEDDATVALTRIDEALALAGETGEHWSDAFLHRLRGEFLLKRDPANTGPAEDAFLTAIGVAQQQKAHSFELRAALSLSRLYHSTNRSSNAHALLASALEGFTPTPEFPEIEEAQALLAALAETDEVKNAAAARQRRLKLQTSLGRALMFSRGFGADESKAAFIRARELGAAVDNPTERFTVYYGLWLANQVRGELGLAREIAETFLREAERGALTMEYGVGRRLVGITCFFQGDFTEAQANLVEALSASDPERDRETKFRFGDIGASARVYLAFIRWLLGEVRPARALIEEAVAHAIETGHVPSLVNTYVFKAHFEIVRGDAAAARRAAEIVIRLSQEKALTLFAAVGKMQSAWASARLDGDGTGPMELRQALAAFTDQGNRLEVPFFQGLLAEIEAEGNAAGALTRIDQALALAGETGEHCSDSFLHHLRGKILLKCDPTNAASAKTAFLTAIGIAQQQKARSFELRAALDLARLYHSTGRSADAHALLASALEGFSPTPEFPEIEEAETLLAMLTS